MEINSWDSDDDIIKQMNFISERGADHLSPRGTCAYCMFQTTQQSKTCITSCVPLGFLMGHNNKAWWL